MMRPASSSKRNASTPSERQGGGASIQAVQRALRLLDLLSQQDEGARLGELAERSSLAPSTVHRLLTTMEEQRFVQFSPADGFWHIGQASYRTGMAFTRRGNMAGLAIPFLRRLRDKARETVNLAAIQAGEIVMLSQIEGRDILRSLARPGDGVGMTSSGLGRAILAHYPEAEIEQVIQRVGLPRITPRSIVRPGDFAVELARIRSRGFALDDEEVQVGLRCVAAAIFDATGDAIGAVSISGPATRLADARIESLGALVAEAAAAITEALGGVVPGPESPNMGAGS